MTRRLELGVAMSHLDANKRDVKKRLRTDEHLWIRYRRLVWTTKRTGSESGFALRCDPRWDENQIG
jgi:hypothetical protein